MKLDYGGGKGTWSLPNGGTVILEQRSIGGGGTVAHRGTLLGSESTYMEDATKSAGIVCEIAGIDPLIDYHWNPGQILPHFYVQNIFLAPKLTKLHYLKEIASDFI